jgi:hypothetical protein
MNPEEFTSRIMMPTPQPMEEPEVEETPEHPNTPILENMMVNQSSSSEETNQLLEHTLIKIAELADKTLEEHQLIKTAEVVDELKSLKEVIKENNQWEVNLILE